MWGDLYHMQCDGQAETAYHAIFAPNALQRRNQRAVMKGWLVALLGDEVGVIVNLLALYGRERECFFGDG